MEKISLKICSYGDADGKATSTSDNDWDYYSALRIQSDNWIVYSSGSDLFLPLTVKIAEVAIWIDVPSDFNVYIGDAEKEEWIKCDKQLVEKKQHKFTLFDEITRLLHESRNEWIFITCQFMRIYCGNDEIPDEIISICLTYTGTNILNEIIKKKYIHFKWEILVTKDKPYFVTPARQFFLCVTRIRESSY